MCCAHLLPRAIKSMVQSVEGVGSELRAAVLVCSAKSQLCQVRQVQKLSVLASPDTLDTDSWNPNTQDVNQRMPK